MMTELAPMLTSSSITILWGEAVAARTAIVTLCQIHTLRPITTLLWMTVPKPWWPKWMSGLTSAPGASELW
jgi:hypothetical protein